MASLSKIRHEIEVANTFIERDEQTARELRAALEELGDVEAEITHWRVIQSRERKPVSVIPLHLNDKKIEAEALRETIRATEEIIEANRAKIARLNDELAEAEAAATDATWQFISDEADRLAKVLIEQQAAYTDTARKLFALNQLSRPGKSEYFTPETQRVFAPLPIDAPRTAYLQASDLDPFQYAAQIKPYVTAAQAWRAALIENPRGCISFRMIAKRLKL